MLSPLLQLIDKWAWIGEILVLFVLLFFALRDKKINSGLIAMTITVILGFIMRFYAPYLKAITEPEYYAYVLLVYYVGFFIIDMIAIYLLYKLHVTFIIRYSFISKMIIAAFFIKGQLHFVRYSERLLMGFDSNYLKPLYQAGIPAVNIGIVMTSLAFVLAMGVSRYRVAEGKGGLNWLL